MTNRYPGTCPTCRQTVAVGEGDTVRNAAGRWVTTHVVCPPTVNAAPAGDPVTEAGMYALPDGTICKVQVAVHGSGNLYAKRLTVTPGESKGTFAYEAGLIRSLTASMRLTRDAATAFGHLYGMCCVCGATLTDERSIEAGIGPVCGGRL